MADFSDIQAASDRDSYEYVKSQGLHWVVAIEAELKKGHKPQDIADYFKDDTERRPMALRVLQAARHMERGLRS